LYCELVILHLLGHFHHFYWLQDFVRVLAHFRPIKKNAEKNKLNTRMEKLHFAFRMYDLDGDDKISKVIITLQYLK
jgi:hypothetical protein